MTIIEGGIRPQCKLTLRHISRIAKAMNAQGQLRDVVHGICFVTHTAFIGEARRQWERRTTNAIMDYIVLPALPRDALVEWQVWAHTHNDRFDCKTEQIFILYIYVFPTEPILIDLCRRGNWLLGQRLHHLDTSSLEL